MRNVKSFYLQITKRKGERHFLLAEVGPKSLQKNFVPPRKLGEVCSGLFKVFRLEDIYSSMENKRYIFHALKQNPDEKNYLDVQKV